MTTSVKTDPMPNHQRVVEIEYDVVGWPYIIVVSGHFCSGKSIFVDKLILEMLKRQYNPQGVINFKSRGQRTTEVLGIDYYPVKSDEDFFDRVAKGSIVVPYQHDGFNYGLSKSFLVALDKGKVPVMITDAGGLAALIQYLGGESLPNKLISFMLHTDYADAIERLINRAYPRLSEGEFKGIQEHLEGLPSELALYREHEDLFRHVFRNDTIEDVPKHRRIGHLTKRAMDVLNLERRLNAESAEDFREGYAMHVLTSLFGSDITIDGLLHTSPSSPIGLKIPDEVIHDYAQRQNLDKGYIKGIACTEVIRANVYYGLLSLYLEGTITPHHKKILLGLIEKTVGLTPQYEETELKSDRTSKRTLRQLAPKDRGGIDFYVSFSPYDPMRLPSVESKVHTVAFESVPYNRNFTIQPLPESDARRHIENGGLGH